MAAVSQGFGSNRSKSIFKRFDPNIGSNGHLREPQREGYHAIHEHFRTSNEPAVVQLPVGCGKSGLIATVPFGLASERVLCVAPNVTIRDTLSGAVDSGRAECFWRKMQVAPLVIDGPFTANIDDGDTTLADCAASHFVVTNIQRVGQANSRWLKDFPKDFFDMILIDEGHHNAADSWLRLIEHFSDAKVVSFTATPFRSDGKEVIGKRVHPMRSTSDYDLSSSECLQSLLGHVHRFGLTVPSAFANCFSLSGGTPAGQLLLDTLVEQELLHISAFRDGATFYYLSPRAAELLNLDTSHAIQPKIAHHAILYGTLYYATMGDAPRKRLTTAEFIRDFPELYEPGPQINYVIEPDGKLSFVRLDGNPNTKTAGTWERLFSTIDKLIERRCRVKAFRELYEAGDFSVVLLTSTTEKVAQVNARIDELIEEFQRTKKLPRNTRQHRRPSIPPPRFQIEFIPGLFDLMFPRPNRS